MEKFNQLKALLESITPDAEKFYDKENNAAGLRLRKGLQELKKLAQDVKLDSLARTKKK